MKNNFIYLSSWDELTWTLDTGRRFYRCLIPWDQRSTVRNWIREQLSHNVFCWNGTSSPDPGSTQWYFVTPLNEQTWLIFEDEQDESIFCLRFSYCIEEVFNNGNQAWWDSRKTN